MIPSASAGGGRVYRSVRESMVGFKWGFVLGLAVSWASMLLVSYLGPRIYLPMGYVTPTIPLHFNSTDFGELRGPLVDPYVSGVVGVALIADSLVGVRRNSAWSGMLAGLLIGFVIGILVAPAPSPSTTYRSLEDFWRFGLF